MKLHYTLLALILGMCGVLVAAFMIDEVPTGEEIPEGGGDPVITYLGHGFTHPEHEAMQAGGDGAERHANVLWLGWIFAMLQVVYFLVSLIAGASRKGKAGPFLIPIVIGGVVYAAVFTMVFVSYRGYMTEDVHDLVLALPASTAWMIYGVWFMPLFFMLLFMFKYDSWIFTKEDQAEFDRIVAARRASEAGES